MLNLDPRLVDQDKIRHERRKKYFKIALIPLVFLIVIAAFFLRTSIYNLTLSIGESKRNYGPTKTLSNIQTFVNVIEPYLTFYDRGYAKLLTAQTSEDLQSAESDFQESLRKSPPESRLCSIYINYSYAIELEGDLSFKSKDYNKALIAYNRAESMLYENNCVMRGSSSEAGKDELAKNAKKRLEEKRKETLDALNNIEEGDDDSGDDNKKEEQTITEKDIEDYQKSLDSKFDRAMNYLHRHTGGGNINASIYDPRF